MKKDDIHNRYREEEQEEIRNEKKESDSTNDDAKQHQTIGEEKVETKSEKQNETREDSNQGKNEEPIFTIDLTTPEEKMLEEINSLKTEIAILNDKYLRALADMENFKKRMNEERIRDRIYANQSLLEKFISVTDIFDKAVNIKTDDPKFENFLIGFRMINDNIKSILESEGVKKIEAIGKPFDYRYHMAVDTAYDESKEENIVLEEFQAGYLYKDRVLRPSRVKVNKKPDNQASNENLNNQGGN
ncbi:MAG TPA: nucleotide exchange factor GrpE [Bacilli bacterium]|nr:nucleotide exchange factor GrpE [Bacilli bacterium]